MPLGLTTPAIHCARPSRSRRKWCRYISGEVGFSSLCGWMVAMTASLSYSFRPSHDRCSPARFMPSQDARQRLLVPAQGAGDQAVEVDALLREVFAQADALLVAEVAELVVVVGAEGGLAVPHEVEGSHAGILAAVAGAVKSPVRRSGARCRAGDSTREMFRCLRIPGRPGPAGVDRAAQVGRPLLGADALQADGACAARRSASRGWRDVAATAASAPESGMASAGCVPPH